MHLDKMKSKLRAFVAARSSLINRNSRSARVSYTGSEIINVHKTKEQREHNKTLFPNPNQNNNSSVLRHLSPVHERDRGRSKKVQ